MQIYHNIFYCHTCSITQSFKYEEKQKEKKWEREKERERIIQTEERETKREQKSGNETRSVFCCVVTYD